MNPQEDVSENNTAPGSAGLGESVNQGITGNHNIMAGGDVNIGSIQIMSENSIKAQFDPEKYSDQLFHSPVCTDAIITLWKSTQFVIIHGRDELSKHAFLRHLAWRIHRENPELKCEFRNFSMDKSENLQGILDGIQNPQILVLDQLESLNIQGNPSQIASLAKAKNVYVVASASQAKERWGVEEVVLEQFWFEIPKGKLYADELLARVFHQYLQKYARQLNFDKDWEWFLDAEETNTQLVQAAIQLGNPDRIWQFFLQLARDPHPVSKAEFSRQLQEMVSNQTGAIKWWFTNSSEKEKMLLLAMALYSGLPDSDFFELIEQAVKERWQYRDRSLLSLDYCDLEGLGHFFAFEQVSDFGYMLTPKLESMSMDVLQEAWAGYRLHIRVTLPLMVDRIHKTVGMGNNQYPIHLRRCLGKTIGNLCILDRNLIYDTLLDFAKSSTGPLRTVAAKTISDWASQKNWNLFVNTVDTWLDISHAESIVYLRVTVLRAINYASIQFPHNGLPDEFLTWMVRFFRDPSEMVTREFEFLMPKLIRNHPRQLAPLLQEEFLRGRENIEFVSEGISDGYNYYPQEVLKILEGWMDYARQYLHLSGIGAKLSQRDRVLLAAVQAYAELDFDRHPQFISREDVLELIIDLRKTERQRDVRGKLMELVLKMMKECQTINLDWIEKMMAQSVFEEKLSLLEFVAGMIADGSSRSFDRIASLLEKEIKSASIQEQPAILRVVGSVLASSLPYSPNFTRLIVMAMIQSFTFGGREKLAELIAKLYLVERAQMKSGQFEISLMDVQFLANGKWQRNSFWETTVDAWLSVADRKLQQTAILATFELNELYDAEQQKIADYVPPTPTQAVYDVAIQSTPTQETRYTPPPAGGYSSSVGQSAGIAAPPVPPPYQEPRHALNFWANLVLEIILLFVVVAYRPNVRVTVETFFLTKKYGWAAKSKALRRWSVSNHSAKQVLGRKLTSFFFWTKHPD